MLLHVIKEANDVVKDVIKETDDVVKGKANVTKEFAKAQRQIYKLISQMPQISAAQMLLVYKYTDLSHIRKL